MFAVFAAALLWPWQAAAQSRPTVRALTGEIVGHHVGGVAVDAVGNVYVADFDATVWRITPEGALEVFATGFYGASGNAVDHMGRLLQASFHDDRVLRVDRDGTMTIVADDGLDGPVGIAPDLDGGGFFVANCLSNSISHVNKEGEVSEVATGPLFACPNGLTRGPDGLLYVANFRDGRVLQVSRGGEVKELIELPSAGLGHLCLMGTRLYVTDFRGHRIYRVSEDGRYETVAGTGERGTTHGSAASARLSFPNGIACERTGRRIYFNEFLGDDIFDVPRRTLIRVIDRPG